MAGRRLALTQFQVSIQRVIGRQTVQERLRAAVVRILLKS